MLFLMELARDLFCFLTTSFSLLSCCTFLLMSFLTSGSSILTLPYSTWKLSWYICFLL